MDFNNCKYQMNFWGFVKTAFSPFIVFLIALLLILPIVRDERISHNNPGVWLLVIFIFCFYFIPPLILQLNYYINDRSKILVIEKSQQIMIMYEGSHNKQIRFSDINIIAKYQSFWIFRVNYKSYYYYKILMNDDSAFYISRLTVEKLEDKLDNIQFEYNSVFFPVIRKDNNLYLM